MMVNSGVLLDHVFVNAVSRVFNCMLITLIVINVSFTYLGGFFANNWNPPMNRSKIKYYLQGGWVKFNATKTVLT